MSDIMDGWNAGERAHLAKQEMERQKREDAWAAEERAQRRNQWQRDATAQTLLEGTVDRVSQNPTNQIGEFAAQYGLPPTERVVPSAAANYNKRQGFFGESEGPGLTLPAEEPKFGIHPKRQGLVDDYKISVAKGDLTGARGIKTQIDTLDMGSQAAALQQRILNAPPDKVAAFAQKYTDSAHIPGSMVVDPKTMLTTLTLDGGKPIQMTRADMATYVTGLWKLNQGDPSGREDIAGIDKSLAAMADKRFGQMKDVAQTNNDNAAKADAMRTNAARVGLARSVAERDKWTPVGVSDDGKALVMLDSTGKTKLQTLPEGVDAAGLFRRLTGAPGGSGKEFTELPEQGKLIEDQRGNVGTFDNGEFISRDGVPYAQRGKVFAAAKLPAQAESMVRWEYGGRYVSVVGKPELKYDINNPQDQAALRSELALQARRQVNEAEATAARGVSHHNAGPRRAAAQAAQDYSALGIANPAFYSGE